MALDLEGVCASSGSACMVGSVRMSHVLLAMGLPMESARSAIRFSLGRRTTAEEIANAADALAANREREPKTRANMPSLRQLEFAFEQFAIRVFERDDTVVGQALRLPARQTATEAVALQLRGRAVDLETKARAAPVFVRREANRNSTSRRMEFPSQNRRRPR